MLKHCPDDLKGQRDRALLALGFAGAFRPSELAALRLEDLAEGASPHVAGLLRRPGVANSNALAGH